MSKEIGASLAQLVTGEGREQISSPVGIVAGLVRGGRRGVENYLWVLGLISLSLALLNLLPLLPLDGGHIVFSLIEGIRGRAVAREVYERVSAVGIAVVLLLFFIGLSNDIGRLGEHRRRSYTRRRRGQRASRSRSATSRSAAARPSSSSR